MRPVAFGEACPAGTQLTLFSDDKPDRFFTVGVVDRILRGHGADTLGRRLATHRKFTAGNPHHAFRRFCGSGGAIGNCGCEVHAEGSRQAGDVQYEGRSGYAERLSCWITLQCGHENHLRAFNSTL